MTTHNKSLFHDFQGTQFKFVAYCPVEYCKAHKVGGAIDFDKINATLICSLTVLLLQAPFLPSFLDLGVLVKTN